MKSLTFVVFRLSAWRALLEASGLGSSSMIIRISAIGRLGAESADNGLLTPKQATGIARVKSAKSVGIRTGNWLSARQAQMLLYAPDVSTLRGLRDRAIITVLLGCGLRCPALFGKSAVADRLLELLETVGR